MRLREKLTVEEKVSLALELIKRERPLDEVRQHYRVSHTTAYKIRNQFLAGGRLALSGATQRKHDADLEARMRALEELVGRELASLVERRAAKRIGRPRRPLRLTSLGG
jgi:hypothetical protein